MKKIFLAEILIGLIVTVMVGISFAEPMKSKATGKTLCNKSVIDLRMAMRKLWEDHITYTRNYIISALADALTEGIVKQFPNKFKK